MNFKLNKVYGCLKKLSRNLIYLVGRSRHFKQIGYGSQSGCWTLGLWSIMIHLVYAERFAPYKPMHNCIQIRKYRSTVPFTVKKVLCQCTYLPLMLLLVRYRPLIGNLGSTCTNLSNDVKNQRTRSKSVIFFGPNNAHFSSHNGQRVSVGWFWNNRLKALFVTGHIQIDFKPDSISLVLCLDVGNTI